MRAAVILALISLAATSGLARADVLWDNGDWQRASNLSSERNTSSADSWTIDDVIVTQPVLVREFEWVSIMSPDLTAVAVDLIVLSEDFATVIEISDLAYSRVFDGNAYGDYEVYRVVLSDLSIPLPPGRYFIGGRMVGDGIGRAVSGLNDTVFGQTTTYFRSDYFGVYDWTQIVPLDLAFEVRGEIVPAPTTVAVLVPGFLAARRRR